MPPTPTTAPADGRVQITCSECPKSIRVKPTATGKDRTPKGWKKLDHGFRCGECQRKAFVLRSISLPIVGPVGDETETWAILREALRTSWAEATALHNWLMTELYVRDIRRTAALTKMPPMPAVYLYPEARARFPEIPSQTVAATEQAVKGKYGASRYELLWTGECALPNYRYPTPFSAPNQGWSLVLNEQEQPIVAVRIAGRRWHLRLRSGKRYARQMAALRSIANGSAIKGELSIYRKRAGEWGNDGGVTDRENGQRVAYDVMVKLVAWLPRTERRTGAGTLFVRTANDSLLIAVDDAGERIWTLNFDHLRKWVAEHRKRLDRWSEDQKAENRPVPSFAAARDAEVTKHHRRLDTAVKEAARQLANYARRRGVAVVKLNDTDRGFCAEFPYFALLERLRVVLDEYKVDLVVASTPVTQEA